MRAASPTRATSGTTFVTIATGSTSIRTSRPRIGSGPFHRSDGASSVPIATTTSAPATRSATAARWMPAPRESGWSSGSTPFPFAVVTTGAPSRSARARTSAAAALAPPPTSRTGVAATARRAAAAAVSVAGAGDGDRRTALAMTTSPDSASTSSGTSRWTGRGRPEVMIAKACASAMGISATLVTRILAAATAARAAPWSFASCRMPLPSAGWRTGRPGEMTSTGTESEYACPTAAAAFSSAGPLVTIATPGRPVVRA